MRTPVFAAILIWNIFLSCAGVRAARPYYDPWIVCSWSPVVPPEDAGWPTPEYSPNEYLDTISFCSAYWGSGNANMGCVCTSDRPTSVHCGTGAPQALLNAVLDPTLAGGATNFVDWCTDVACWCEQEDAADQDRALLKEAASATTQLGVDELDTQPAVTHNEDGTITIHLHGGHNVTIAGNEFSLFNSTTGQCGFGNGCTIGSFTENGGIQGTVEAGSDTGTCGSTCMSIADCDISGNTATNSCTCRTATSTYNPATNEEIFTASCLTFALSSGGGKRKRYEDMPCACNSTYVSHGCCLSSTGLIWESSEWKAGEMEQVDL